MANSTVSIFIRFKSGGKRHTVSRSLCRESAIETRYRTG